MFGECLCNFTEVTSNCSVFKIVASLRMWFSRPFKSLNRRGGGVVDGVGVAVKDA